MRGVLQQRHLCVHIDLQRQMSLLMYTLCTYTPTKRPKKRPKKDLTEKQRIALRVKNNEPIDFGTSDSEAPSDAESDAQTDIDEDLEMAQQEREIEQEH